MRCPLLSILALSLAASRRRCPPARRATRLAPRRRLDASSPRPRSPAKGDAISSRGIRHRRAGTRRGCRTPWSARWSRTAPYPDPVLRHEPAQDPGHDVQDRRAVHAHPHPRRQPVQARVVVPHGVRPARGQGRPPAVAALRRHQLPGEHLGERHADRDAPPTWRASSAATSSTSRRSRKPGAKNAVAVEVFGPEPHDLAIMWVDWNPTPADKNMGLWGDVYLTDSGPARARATRTWSPTSTCPRWPPRSSPSPPR